MKTHPSVSPQYAGLCGTVLGDRYEVREVLGQGSSGVVYGCYDRLVCREVAVKVLPGSVREDPIACSRVHREMRTAHSLRHDNLVSLLDCILGEEAIYLVIERVQGADLSQLIDPNVPLDLQHCTRILRQIALALCAIHRAGIVHRDLKPQNILINLDGQVRVTDFGVAQVIPQLAQVEGQPDSPLFGSPTAETGNFVGTPHYAAPEYLDEGVFDHTADLYSLGVITYELISGTLPYDNDNIFQLITDKIERDPVPLIDICPSCPVELSTFCMRLLSREPAKRHQSAEEVLAELDEILGNIERLASSRFSGPMVIDRSQHQEIEWAGNSTFWQTMEILLTPLLLLIRLVVRYQRVIELVVYAGLAVSLSYSYYYVLWKGPHRFFGQPIVQQLRISGEEHSRAHTYWWQRFLPGSWKRDI